MDRILLSSSGCILRYSPECVAVEDFCEVRSFGYFADVISHHIRETSPIKKIKATSPGTMVSHTNPERSRRPTTAISPTSLPQSPHNSSTMPYKDSTKPP